MLPTDLPQAAWNPNNSCEILPSPVETVSQISWHPSGLYLAASSWDNQVRCWKLSRQGNEGSFISEPKACIQHDAPALCCSFNSDGTTIYSGGCDNKVLGWDLVTNQSSVVCEHLGPVKHCSWLSSRNLLMTGSWDKTLMFFDSRQPHPATVVSLDERVYCADVNDDISVVGCSAGDVCIFDLKKLDKPLSKSKSPLKLQTRSVACFTDKRGYALGSIEGRCAIGHVNPADLNQNFAFKCHREGSNIYAVNDIDFHPKYGTFATVGSDGTFNFWDKDTKQRIKMFKKSSLPITCCKFDHTGSLFAYAVGYDWGKGTIGNVPNQQSHILIHSVCDVEIKSRRRGWN